MNINYLFRSGKNPKIIYYLHNYIRYIIPKGFTLKRHSEIIKSLNKREDKDYIISRVNYYNKLTNKVSLPVDSPEISEHKMPHKLKVYFFDTYQYTRCFPQKFQWNFTIGDVTWVPNVPSIVKSRPLCSNNENGVLMKLDKVRHFVFLNDKKDFCGKENRVIFRGKINGKPIRKKLLEMYFNHPMCDLGDVGHNPEDPIEWRAPKLTLYQHLDYKFILALEGNDVASNLKWIMSSNSVAVMPRPTCETWFMEGTLIPNYHYIEIKEDLSDLIERLNYYISHPEEAKEIIEHAHEYVKPFKDRKREDLISLLVLDKYFEKTNQLLQNYE